MKKFLFTITSLLALSLMFTACNRNSPKDAAQKWLTSFYHMDYDAAKAYSTEDTKKMLMIFQQFSSLGSTDSMKTEMAKIKIEIKDVQEKGDSATVHYITSDNNKDQQLHLVKQKGKWLVQWSKTDPSGDESSAPLDQSNAPDTTNASMPPAAPDSSAAPK
jgi:hypothetical protein